MSDTFLSPEEVAELTGYKLKGKQVEWLRSSNIPFWTRATGHPVVARATVEGRKPPPEEAPTPTWTPRVVGVA